MRSYRDFLRDCLICNNDVVEDLAKSLVNTCCGTPCLGYHMKAYKASGYVQPAYHQHGFSQFTPTAIG